MSSNEELYKSNIKTGNLKGSCSDETCDLEAGGGPSYPPDISLKSLYKPNWKVSIAKKFWQKYYCSEFPLNSYHNGKFRAQADFNTSPP